jgi:dolichol-phosphate mannosyltransferase
MDSNTPQQRWTIGVMCFNEAGSIAQVIREVFETGKSLGPTTEILAVDDGSADDTLSILQELQATTYPQLRIEAHGVNKGIGAALRSIYFGASGDVVVAVPGDGQFDTRELLAYPVVPMKTVFSYYRVENTSYNFFRNGLSWMNKALNRILLGLELNDVNWILVFRTADIRGLDLRMKSSIISSEICSKLSFLGWRFIEVRSKYLPRRHGKSRGASFSIVTKALRELLSLFVVVTRFKWRSKRGNR